MNLDKKHLFGMAVLSFFVLIVALASMYTQVRIGAGQQCGCAVPPYLFIPFMGALGLFTGMLIFTIFREEKESSLKLEHVLRVMDKDERKIMKLLYGNTSLMQSEIVEKTGLSKVKVSRLLGKMENKGVIEKEKNGNSNMVKLSRKYEKAG